MDERLRRHEYGFLELASPPDDQALTDYYAQKYYQSEQGNYRKSYPEAELAAIQLRTDLRAHHADQLRGTDQPGRLLDVGCGEGFVLAAYAARGWTVRGIDHSVEGVSMMNPDQLSNVDQGDLFALLDDVIAADTTYDLVWLGNVLEHVRNPVTLLRTLRRLVAPGGLLVATVP
ncbi:MAG: class I SAM-dependent methyltransferase, partial [Pseudomonadota bacterium]